MQYTTSKSTDKCEEALSPKVYWFRLVTTLGHYDESDDEDVDTLLVPKVYELDAFGVDIATCTSDYMVYRIDKGLSPDRVPVLPLRMSFMSVAYVEPYWPRAPDEVDADIDNHWFSNGFERFEDMKHPMLYENIRISLVMYRLYDRSRTHGIVDVTDEYTGRGKLIIRDSTSYEDGVVLTSSFNAVAWIWKVKNAEHCALAFSGDEDMHGLSVRVVLVGELSGI